MRISPRGSLKVATLIGAFALLVPTSIHAQSGPRWRAWIGCWSPVVSQSSATPSSVVSGQDAQLLCVTPTADPDVVEISAIADGRILSRDRLDASGRAQTIDAAGCAGTTRATWSEDQRRIFLRSSVTCQGQPSETSAILAMANGTSAEWLDVRSVSAGGNSEVRVARYRDAGIPAAVPSEIANALRDRDMSVQGARVASTAPIGARDIIEASHSADPAIVEAWLLESGQQFSVDAGTLRQLADAGVPGRVTDALVEASRNRDDRYATDERRVRTVGVYDPWGYGIRYRMAPYPVIRYRPYYYAPVGISFSLFGFGYAPYGYGYVPFGYYPYAYRPAAYVPFGFGRIFAPMIHGRSYHPQVIERPSYPRGDGPRIARPRVERDRGYTEAVRVDRQRGTAKRRQ